MTVDVALEKLNMSGIMQLTVTLDRDAVFPCISSAAVSFTKK